jgi:3-oxoacyl-ACP reductase-like protein
MSTSEKLQRLQLATDEAKDCLSKAKTAFDDSLRRLNAAKEALREMDPEDQERIQVNDTKLPELLDLHSIATEEYNNARSRYETNLRYLTMLKEKLSHKTT